MVRASVIPAPGRAPEVWEFPRPELEPGAVLLETLYSEVCGTDCHLLHGKLSGVPYPLIPGHVSVGRIAEIRGTVRDVHGEAFRVGETVGFLDVHGTCGECWYCLVAKASTRCPNRRVYGITYGAEEGLLGGWGELIYLKPRVRILRLYTGNGPVEINPHSDINRKHLDLRGCWGVDFSHLYRGMEMMSRSAKVIPWERTISAYYGLEQAGQALEDVERLRVIKAVIDPKR